MPRNDQLARQWHILRRLESRRGVTLHELAAALPDDLPKHLRTLRRDLEALEAGGYPLVTERLDGQTRWRLLDGARAPAIGFSPTELILDKPTAPWARDRLWHPSQRLWPLPGGRLRMTLRVADTRELLGWILSFGRGVKVVQPAELRERVRAEELAVARQ
jgi:predicted DNA-binding transcriptional regulator YafY